MTKIALSCLLLLSVGHGEGARERRKERTEVKTDCYSDYDGKHLLSLAPCDADIQEMEKFITHSECEDVSENGFAPSPGTFCVTLQAICPSTLSAILTDRFGDQVSVESTDAGGYLRKRAGVPEEASMSRSSFYNSFKNLAAQTAAVDEAVANSGGACKLEVIGKTHEGREMRAVRVRGSNYQPGGPRVVGTFGIHAREWVAQMSGVYVVEQVCARAKDDPSWLEDAEVMLVPMGNPDGFLYSSTKKAMWRKNRKPKSGGWWSCDGVDLNRNFPADWNGRYGQSGSTCSEVYRGPSSASEPETQAIVKVIDENLNTVLIDVHCYGKYILKPWSYTWDAHPRLAEVDDLGNQMNDAIISHRGASFRYGGNELLGAASGVLPDYANGGLGYTFEMTNAFQPSTSEIQPSVIEAWNGFNVAISWTLAKR